MEAANRVYERNVDYDDRTDLLYQNGKEEISCYAAERVKFFAKSYVISDALNAFGHSGGFKRILDLFHNARNGISSVTIE